MCIQYIYIIIYIIIYTYIHTYTYTHIYTYTHTYTHTFILLFYQCLQYMSIRVFSSRVSAQTHHTHTHTHTHTQSDRSSHSFLWVIHNASGEMWVTSARSFMVRPFYGSQSLLFSRSVTQARISLQCFSERADADQHINTFTRPCICVTHTHASV